MVTNMNPHSKIISDKLIALLNEAVIACSIFDKTFCEKLSNAIGDARIVLMGEATHGTTEFYQARMLLSEYLIREKGFQAIAIEGDWASAYPVYAYLQGKGRTTRPENSLTAFKRFPEWMWRNTTVLELIENLRRYNDEISAPSQKTGFYGLDLYCLNESMQSVIDYFKIHQPDAVHKVMENYACFDHINIEPQLYSYLIEQNLKHSCVKEVTTQLLEIQRLAFQQIDHETEGNEQLFYALQNARVIKNAENYYRSMFEPHHVTWNIRDMHMADTLQNIMSHLENNSGKPAKIIVWAHNSHVGDARATEMSGQQEVNLGQLVRERFNSISFSLGFSTAEGTVMAASEWDGPGWQKKINAPIHGSCEWFFHALNEKNFILNLREDTELTHLLKVPLLQRAIGVIYRPETERLSHYFFSRLPYQFDAIVNLDKTTALTPLA